MRKSLEYNEPIPSIIFHGSTGNSKTSSPDKCPICNVGSDKFEEMKGTLQWADEHRIGVAEGVDPQILEGLRANFMGECTEVGMYLAMYLNVQKCVCRGCVHLF